MNEFNKRGNTRCNLIALVRICAICLLGSDEIGQTENVSYSDGAARYLISGGMTENEVEQLKGFIMT